MKKQHVACLRLGWQTICRIYKRAPQVRLSIMTVVWVLPMKVSLCLTLTQSSARAQFKRTFYQHFFTVPHKGAYIIVLNFCTLSPIISTIIVAITCMCECINSAVFSRMINHNCICKLEMKWFSIRTNYNGLYHDRFNIGIDAMNNQCHRVTGISLFYIASVIY